MQQRCFKENSNGSRAKRIAKAVISPIRFRDMEPPQTQVSGEISFIRKPYSAGARRLVKQGCTPVVWSNMQHSLRMYIAMGENLAFRNKS